MNAEQVRLEESRNEKAPWKKWGPYLSERQWGTVREDCSTLGDAWKHFTHDQARSRAYRWGEDGLAGISDDQQLLCFALALWNGKDPIIKERLFGLDNAEGNHGEDVKEYYFYLDSTPTHSYMKYLYKYPHAAYPYDDLVARNGGRTRQEGEYELMETGVFNDSAYFDVFVEYAKAAPEDILVEITVHNRGQKEAALHVLPTLWFRNTWSWNSNSARPVLQQIPAGKGAGTILADHPELGPRFLHVQGAAEILFTENETNTERLHGTKNATPYVKDAINNYFVAGDRNAVNRGGRGTKASVHHPLTIAAGKSQTIRLRLNALPPGSGRGIDDPFGSAFSEVMSARRKEADAFYAEVIPANLPQDHASLMRQALAGMLWSKQFYFYDVDLWLTERGADPFNPEKRAMRNDHWHHMYNADVISMPDKWEYPWYAAWDLAFHVLALTLVDEDFGKQQLELMLTPRYQHPNGQLPAYEWNFADVNPPVHAWATIFTYRTETARKGQGDAAWLERCFQKLLTNFTWWVNRKDRTGSNVFEGGFLGLDNIGVFDRSSPLPGGGYLDQADGTAWMALYCQNMLEITAELALDRPAYLEMMRKFVDHFLWIATSMLHSGKGTGMWDEEDGFFYDVLQLPDGSSHRLKVRSMVGLLPLCASSVFEPGLVERHPRLLKLIELFRKRHSELLKHISPADGAFVGYAQRRLLSVCNKEKIE
ncbi:MAG: MGH1-like glycoside hydrolase domain-containing protein, partial [Phycisphaerae bacterium]